MAAPTVASVRFPSARYDPSATISAGSEPWMSIRPELSTVVLSLDWCIPMTWNQLLNEPKAVRRSSLIAGYIAGETCSVYAIFIAHTMNPVSYRLVEDNRKLRAIYGRYQEIFNWDGL